ncbi:methylhydantoinase [Superficieibacter electus]|uniref:Methylhydantoinase n=1 Tax=Superficieibacter electus TaxID=2022662 RepID=A0A2P5GUE1_9ENTR|nr:hydantoinase/oxoprolinase family protein [Superficieibacter electus]POP50175.1 methylhydantoinase [Superficieibacter electus]
MSQRGTRIAVDIGGTFTDIVLQRADGTLVSAKRLTTHGAPEEAVLQGIDELLHETATSAAQVSAIVHGTTLATNALIERKGAKTALITTAGFRDTLEIAHEHRFDVSDLYMQRPQPLVPRERRFEVAERLAADGSVLKPLDHQSLAALLPQLDAQEITSVAIGFLHSYVNGDHELQAAAFLRQARPELAITLSHEVCPEIREYERISTACANAYVQPVIARYLQRLDRGLRLRGIAGQTLLMMSNGGLTSLEQACRFPVLLVESGPAGGAVFAAHIAREAGIAQAVAFDMGGTTAKVVFIDNGVPQYGRELEVARAYRFLKGSGMPLRIPVVDMVEIGAGGGSLAKRNALGLIDVGPESSGSEPGPACYGRGGELPAITDADLLLGKIETSRFAGGKIALSKANAVRALQTHLSDESDDEGQQAAMAMVEVVDENMANAARVHATDRGLTLEGRTLIAFGGAAPMHAARVAQKMGITQIIVPKGAGVGSAHGFLLAPLACEVVKTHLLALNSFDAQQVNAIFDQLYQQAKATLAVSPQQDAALHQEHTVYMRYQGQGHEIPVRLSGKIRYEERDVAWLTARFEEEYARHFHRIIPGMQVECLTWGLRLSLHTPVQPLPAALVQEVYTPEPQHEQRLVDLATLTAQPAGVFRREDLRPGARLQGPAIIAESETNTVVPQGFSVSVSRDQHLILHANREGK